MLELVRNKCQIRLKISLFLEEVDTLDDVDMDDDVDTELKVETLLIAGFLNQILQLVRDKKKELLLP